MSGVPSTFVADVARALETLSARAEDATAQRVADGQIELLARHLRAVVRMSGETVADWRLGLLRKALDRSLGVTLSSGQLGHRLRHLAITPDSRDVSIDRLLNGLVVLAVEEHMRAAEQRIQSAERDGLSVSRTEQQAAAEIASLEQRALEAENDCERLHARLAELEGELDAEQRRVEFLRGFVPDDVAKAADDPERRPSDLKRRVERGIYSRERADGSMAFQVSKTASRPSATFDDLQAAVAYRDGAAAPAGIGADGDAADPGLPDTPAGPPAKQERVAA